MAGFWELISPFLLPVYYVAIFFVVVNLLLENRNPLKTHSYLLLLLLLPFIGIIIYLFFGQNLRKRKIFAKRQLINQAFGSQYVKDYLDSDTLEKVPETIQERGQYQKLIRFLSNDLSPLSLNNKVTILKNGEVKFPVLMEALSKAKKHIHIEYYIYDNDTIGGPLADLLIQKAQEGLEVRLILDGVGSLHLKKSFFKKLRKGGVEVTEFMPVLFPSFTSKINYRDHRKIVVIDGKVGFTGGINVDERYVNNGRQKLYWRDTHLKIEGEAVKTLQLLFLLNWQFVTQHEFNPENTYFPQLPNKGEHCVQINASGPDWELASIMDSFFIAINSARKSVRIVTPYFIPNESIMDAIITAARSNIEVQLMIPHRSDSWIVQAASLSFIDSLLKVGIKVFLYKKGFLHSKVIIIDDTFASVGTANMDYRSFDLNHEVNTYLYDHDVVRELTEHFEEDKDNCTEMSLAEWQHRHLRQKLKESLCRLLAPLL